MDTDKGKGGQKSPNKKLSERLLKERQEALKLLESQAKKSTKVPSNMTNAKVASALFGKKSPTINEENLTTNKEIPKKDKFATPEAIPELKVLPLRESSQSNTALNSTEYVPRKFHGQNDISELLSLDSINISSSSSIAATPSPDVSFYSKEMAGRSTLYVQRGSQLSINEILMQSTVPSVRESAMQKNPRPTTWSQASSFGGGDGTQQYLPTNETFSDNVDFSFAQEIQNAQNNLSAEESFAPAELMHSRLTDDEIEWAQENLPIPSAKFLSKDAQAKLAARGLLTESFKNTSSSMLMRDSKAEMSVGQFFQQHSEDLHNMVSATSPPSDRRTAPVALISDEAVIATTTSAFEFTYCDGDDDDVEQILAKKPAIDDRTYVVGLCDSKDAGNVTAKLSERSGYVGLATLPAASDASPIKTSAVNAAANYGFVSALVGLANAAQSGNSSPCSSVASAPTGCGGTFNKYGYGALPKHTYSSNSVKSIQSSSTRSASRCSNNSVFSHRDERILPLKATALELSWGSVKLHKGSQKSIQIRNTSNKRLAVRVLTYGAGFQLISPDSNLLSLTSQECRTVVINFRPTIIGPAIGKLSFQPPRALNSNCELIIPLYAYGGHASISIQNIIKGPCNVPFFPIGELCDLLMQPLESELRIYNKGPLSGFAYVTIEPSGPLHVPGLLSAFSVYPECTLIAPNTVATIRLMFAPHREDLKNIKKVIGEVLTLARLRIIYGDEAVRQRLRQIRNGLRADDERREKHFVKSLDKLWKHIPGENAIEGIDGYKEVNSVASDIWNCMAEQEASITLNNNIKDETAAELSTIFSEADNTKLFRTICMAEHSEEKETDTSPQSQLNRQPAVSRHHYRP